MIAIEYTMFEIHVGIKNNKNPEDNSILLNKCLGDSFFCNIIFRFVDN